MPTTRDYAKVDHTTLRVQVFKGNVSEGAWERGGTVRYAEYPLRSKGLAKHFATSTLIRYGFLDRENDAVTWQATIEQGTYVNASFYDDNGYGHVNDATWEKDDDGIDWYGQIVRPSGDVEWDEA